MNAGQNVEKTDENLIEEKTNLEIENKSEKSISIPDEPHIEEL